MKKKRPSNFFIMLIQLILLLLSTSKSHAGKGKENGGNPQTKPNIVFIVADDLGWDDVSFHGSPQIPTPNLDSLAMSGVILNNYYVSPSSFATKCEFMTGKYGTTLGVQHGVFHNKQPMGLPKKEKILPEYLKDLGYETHAVGKWGLGFHEERLLPWKRGFDTFFGALTSSSQDYFTHSAYDENYGLDLRRNEEIIHNATGYYATEMYTEEAVKVIKNAKDTAPFFLYVAHQAMHSGNADDPLQVPPCYLKKVPHIKNEKRKLYAGMVAALDESILNISIALSDRNLLENTIIIFTSDAGGAVGGMELNSGSNYPLRGSKMTVWEGGVRGVAFVYSEMIRDTARVSQEMFHSTDWVPTILRLVDANSVLSDKLDGFDIWASISNTKKISPRFEILHQFDPLQKNQCALRVGDYKLVINQDIGFYGDWYPRPSDVGELKNLTKPLLLPNAKVRCDRNYPHPFLEMHAPPCDPIKKPCLFNIQWDPCEFHNLAEFMPNTLKVLMDRLQYYRSSVTYPIYPKFDVKSDPEDSDGIWGPWTTSSNNNTSNNVKETQTNSASSPSASSPSVIALSAGPPTYTVSANSSELESVATKTQPINLDNHVDYSRPDEHEISALPSPPQETPTVQGNNTTTSIPAWTSELENKTQTPSPLYNVDIYGYKNDNQDINQAVGTKVKPEMNATFENVSNITPNHNENSTDNNQTQQTQAPPFLRNNNTENSNSILPTEVPTGAENRSFVDISMEIPQPKTVDNGVKQFSNNVFDIVADPNDYVGISVAHRNGSNEKSHEFATIADESVNHAEGSTKTDVDENLTHIHIHQNESSDNPMEFVVESNELTKKKNSSQLTSSVTDNALVYMDRNEHGQENKQIFTYESGPMSVPTSQSKSQMIELEKKPNATVAEAKNETNENVTTGKEIPEKENPKIASSELESLLPIPVAPNAIPSPNRKLTLLEDKVTSPYDMEENKEKNPSDEVSKMLPKTKEKSSEFKLPPAVSIQKAASLRPDGKKKPAPAGDAMSLKLGTGSDTATSSESSVGAEAGTLTAVESESKLPALQRPLILSALKNLADAGEKGKGGKQGMSSEVALVTGSYIGKGEGKKPVASNFIKEPEYSEITEPEYEKPQNPFAQSSESAKSGATSGAGATTESETVVGSLAETGSDTKIKSKTGPKLISGTKQITPAEETNAEAVGKAMKEVTSIEPVSIKHPSSFVKANKNYIGSSLKATSSHDPFDAEFSLGHGQHNDLPNPVIAGHRHFSSVADVVSDSSSQNCEKGRDCVPHQNILTEPDNKKELFGITGTQATSNLLPKSNRNSTLGEDMPQDTLLNQLPPVEKLHRFFGEIKVDDSKLFYISGTASEDKNLVVPSTASSTLISNENQATKHKIGFNVVLPSTILRQVPASAPQFKERSKVQNSTKTIKSRIGESPFAHSKTKYAIKKVFDMIADPARTRKTKVEVPSLEENIVTGKSNIEQPAAGGTGEAGDIGATKPLKGMLISLKPQPIISTINDTNDPDISKVMETSHNTESGDLGSIVTLVGKVDKDRSTSRRTKHNLTDESNAHKKTVNKDHMSLKHLPHNNSASETNAANVDHIQGPSNSIIVSSVIVVLVASFVVVGLAVVAIVAVVARHCRLGRHIEAS